MTVDTPSLPLVIVVARRRRANLLRLVPDLLRCRKLRRIRAGDFSCPSKATKGFPRRRREQRRSRASGSRVATRFSTLRRISSVMTGSACWPLALRTVSGLRDPWRGDRRRCFFGSGPITAA
jgi:hypothetical protein